MSLQSNIRVILGTHTVGDSVNGSLVAFDTPEDVQALLNKFKTRGYREIDTAANYPDNDPGSSEDRLGKADAASQFIVHTKVLDGANNTPGPHQYAKVTASIDQSLKSLHTDCVETIFLHVPDRTTSFEDTAKAIHDAFIQGKARNFGLSNYTAAEVKAFIDICEDKGYKKPTVYQGHYNALTRGGEEELFPLLRKNNMAFLAYSPAAGGVFSGNMGSSERWIGNNNIATVYSSVYDSLYVQKAVDAVIKAVQEHGISGHAAAIRWTAYHSLLDGQYGDGLVFGVSKLQQMDMTLDALEAGPLPQDIADAITVIYATMGGSKPPYHL